MSNAILPTRSCKHGKCLINLGHNLGSVLLKVINNNIQNDRAGIFIKNVSNNAFFSLMISQLNYTQKYGCSECGNNRAINTWGGRTVVVFEHSHMSKRLKNHNKLLRNKNKEKHPKLSETSTDPQYIAQENMDRDNGELMLKLNTKNLFGTHFTDNSDKKITTKKLELIRTFSKQEHGKISIIFKQSYKFKKDPNNQTTVNITNSKNHNDCLTQLVESRLHSGDSGQVENITNLKMKEKRECFPIIKMAKISNIKGTNALNDYVGKMKIIFNHTGKYKSLALPSSGTVYSDQEGQNSHKECSVYSTELKVNDEAKNIFSEDTNEPEKLAQSFESLPLKNSTYNTPQMSFDNSKPLEFGKMNIKFDHSTKTKSFNKIGNVSTKSAVANNDSNNAYTTICSEEPNTALNLQTENELPVKSTFVDEFLHAFFRYSVASANTLDSCKPQEQVNMVDTIPKNKNEICHPSQENTCNINKQTVPQNELAEQSINNDAAGITNTLVHKVKFLPKKRKSTKSMSKSKRKLPPSATRIAMEKSKQSLDRLIMFNNDPQCGFTTGTGDKTKSVEDMVEGTKPGKTKEQGLKEKIIVQKFETCTETITETENKEISQCHLSVDKESIQSECKMETTDTKSINIPHSENNLEFMNLFSNAEEIGIMAINSTRTAEPIDSNDSNFYKKIFTLTNTLKKVDKKKTPSCKLTENKSFPSNETNKIKDLNTNPEVKEDEKQLNLLQTDPLDRKLFLQSVSNLLEITQMNEFIDDLIKVPSCKMKNSVMPNEKSTYNSQDKNKIEVTNHKGEQLGNPAIPVSHKFQMGYNKMTFTEESKINPSPPPVKKEQISKIVSNVSQNEQPTKNPEQENVPNNPIKITFYPVNESPVVSNSLKNDDSNSSSNLNIKKNAAPPKMIHHFEILQGVINFPQGTKVVKSAVKDRMQAYQDISKKFEKMGLYRKAHKKKLIEQIEDSKKKSLATIKRDLQLQEKYKNTSKGKRMQEYFHSFRFRLTTTMKEYSKRKNSKNNKKMLISSKLGKLNPPTSPSKPSFARKGNRKNKYV